MSETPNNTVPDEALIREVASWLHLVAPKPPGPSDPPLYSPAINGPMVDAERRKPAASG